MAQGELTRCCESGAYVLRERQDANVTIIDVGSEMRLAIEAADALEMVGIVARMVSLLCQRLFEQQTREHRRETMLVEKTVAMVIEAYAVKGWERYAYARISIKTLERVCRGKDAYKYFDFDGAVIWGAIQSYLEDIK
jgi:dihydroxyacetone synthase